MTRTFICAYILVKSQWCNFQRHVALDDRVRRQARAAPGGGAAAWRRQASAVSGAIRGSAVRRPAVPAVRSHHEGCAGAEALRGLQAGLVRSRMSAEMCRVNVA